MSEIITEVGTIKLSDRDEGTGEASPYYTVYHVRTDGGKRMYVTNRDYQETDIWGEGAMVYKYPETCRKSTPEYTVGSPVEYAGYYYAGYMAEAFYRAAPYNTDSAIRLPTENEIKALLGDLSSTNRSTLNLHQDKWYWTTHGRRRIRVYRLSTNREMRRYRHTPEKAEWVRTGKYTAASDIFWWIVGGYIGLYALLELVNSYIFVNFFFTYSFAQWASVGFLSTAGMKSFILMLVIILVIIIAIMIIDLLLGPPPMGEGLMRIVVTNIDVIDRLQYTPTPRPTESPISQNPIFLGLGL